MDAWINRGWDNRKGGQKKWLAAKLLKAISRTWGIKKKKLGLHSEGSKKPLKIVEKGRYII